jgi:UDP-N-acetylmuramoylalanine--D-glutamate ligase
VRVLVYGLGRSGMAVSRLLKRQGHEVVFYDAKPEPEQLLELTRLGFEAAADPQGADADICIAAPGVPWQHPDLVALRARGIETIGEVEWVSRTIPATMAGITGTAGKTTVTCWLTEVLQGAGLEARAGGNVDPALSEVAAPGITLVTELSSFMLERCPSIKPKVAVLLNLGVDHLDRHGSVAAYHAAKRNLLKNMDANDVFVYNADDPILREWAGACPATTWGYSLKRQAEASLLGDMLLLFGERLVSARELKLKGKHNLGNALAVALAASALGVAKGAIVPGLRDFSGVPGRYSVVAEIAGVTFIEDSIATRSLAVKAALEATPAPIVWIGGGLDKGADFEPVEALVREKVVLFIGVGAAGPYFAERLATLTETAVCAGPSGQEALASACRKALATLRAQGGGTVLLSPLAASFDQFRDYAERARVFREVVMALKEEALAWT